MNTSLVTNVAVNEDVNEVGSPVDLGRTGSLMCKPGTVPKVQKFLSQCSSLVERLPMTLP
jgi:hypothetical protein